MMHGIHKNIYACLFSVHNTISLSGHEQVWSISRNVAQLNILVHDMINLLYYDVSCKIKIKKTMQTIKGNYVWVRIG